MYFLSPLYNLTLHHGWPPMCPCRHGSHLTTESQQYRTISFGILENHGSVRSLLARFVMKLHSYVFFFAIYYYALATGTGWQMRATHENKEPQNSVLTKTRKFIPQNLTCLQ